MPLDRFAIALRSPHSPRAIVRYAALAAVAFPMWLTFAACTKTGGDDEASAAAINAAVADTATGRARTKAAAPVPNVSDATPNGGGWLDQSLRSWNIAGVALPQAPNPREPGVYATGGRCAMALQTLNEKKTTVRARRRRSRARMDSAFVNPAMAALARAGWTIVGQPRVFGNVAVLTAAVDADGMCRPFKYQTFVFERGEYAGTLSPHTMDARTDGALSDVSSRAPQQLTASFNRYKADDALCCPSRRTVVHYRVQRDGGHSIVVPADTKTTSNRVSSATR